MSEDTERKRPSQGNPPSSNRRGKGRSGHGRKATEPEAPTFCRSQRVGQVKTQKESDRARGTNKLETADRETSQDTERKRTS